MVYRGRPAKGCLRCRKRRIKCDLIEAGCGNCTRAGSQCSGYRKQIDLMFCDQTDDTARKVTNRDTANSVWRRSKSSDSSDESVSVASISGELAVVSMDDFALRYCRSHHLVRLPGANICLKLVDEKLLNCLKALGVASYSTTIEDGQLAAQGRKYYVSAIQLLNRDLAVPEEAIKDNSLLTVITLSYYESVSGTSWRSLETWSKHIQGVAALIELRGLAQLKTSEGRLLLHQATACLIFDCLRVSMRLPYCIHDLVKVLTREIGNPNDPPWRVQLALIDLVELKADMHEDLTNDPQDTVYRLLKIEEDLRSAFHDVGPDWGYSVKRSNHTLFREYLPEYHRVYGSALSAQLRNAANNARIVCHGLICCILEQSPAETVRDTAGMLENSSAAMHRLQTEILAGVPQHLGLDGAPTYEAYCLSPDDNSPQCPTTDMYRVAKTSSILPVLRTPHHYIFIWALLMAGEVAPFGGPQRKAICEMLIYTGKYVGMAQAFVFANALEQNQYAAAALGMRAAEPWERVRCENGPTPGYFSCS